MAENRSNSEANHAHEAPDQDQDIEIVDAHKEGTDGGPVEITDSVSR